VISKGASDSFESISWYSLPLIVLIGISIDIRENYSKNWNSNDTINSLKAGLYVLPNAFAFALILYMMFWMPVAAIMVILIGTFITAITIMILSDFLKLDSAHSRQVVQILEDVQIPNPGTVATMYPHELSGGMRQRVMIAMMMSCEPNLLIADEPTTALDVTIQAQILKLMREMRDRKGTSIMLITHDLGVIAEMCDTVSVMYAGTIVESGSLENILTNPRMPYTIGLLHSIPRIIKESEGDRKDSLPIIPGQVPSPNEHFDGCRFHPRCPFADEICISTKPENVEITPGHFAACHHVDKTNSILEVESAFENLASKLMEVN
jgi:oligopeptide/dipeptide ABC transporter ATP-binding protein